MLVRLASGLAVMIALLGPGGARADCAQDIAKLMSRDTEKLTTRYQRAVKRSGKQAANARASTEECRAAKQLQPLLTGQIAALRQSNCSKDPQVAAMVADIIRAHEDDLAMLRKSVAKPGCR